MGAATEGEIILQWKAAVDILESFRVHADDTQAGASGKIDALEIVLNGEFTPVGCAVAAANFKAGLASLVSPAVVQEFLDPIFREYAKVIDTDGGNDTFGGGYTAVEDILEAMYEFFIANSTTVEDRDITFGTPAITTATGNGAISRLKVDENNHELAACHVEKKHFRCRRDANSGAKEEAEVFQYLGSSPSPNGLLRGIAGNRGSGGSGLIRSRNAGEGGAGGGSGSFLNNGSFSEFASGTTEKKFAGWAQSYSVMTASGVTSSSTVYRSFPSETTALSAELTVTGGSTNKIVLTQTLADMATSELKSDRPYFLRCMVRDGSVAAAGGSFKMRLGKQSTSEVTLAITSMTGAWQEVILPLGQNSWFNKFNEDGFGVDVEWIGGTSGSVLIDDMILCEMDLIDGTYWVMRMNNATPVRWLVDDELTVTDSYAGSFGDGKLQYYTWLGYGRYLPSAASPSITDP